MSKRKTQEEFIIQAKKKHGNKFDYSKVKYIDNRTEICVICPEHGEFWITPKSHLLYDCKKCSYNKRAKNYTLTTQEFIEKAKAIHKNKYDYSEVEYKGTKIPICIICSKHGKFYQKPNDHLSNKGCPKCNESKLEKEVRQFLEKKGIKFIPQYKTKWLGKQSLDFYLPEYNTAIECQGKQHFKHGGWTNNFDFNKLMELDRYKFILCKENNIDIYYYMNSIEYKYISDEIIYKNYIYTNMNNICDKILIKSQLHPPK